MDNLENERLRLVMFKDNEGKMDIEGLKNSFEELKNEKTTKKHKQDYKLEVMVSFWLAIHIENVEMAQVIYTLDPIIEKVLKSMREQGEQELELKHKRDRDKERKNKQNRVQHQNDSDEGSPEKSDTLKLPDINKKQDKGKFTDDWNIRDLEDLKDIKYLLTSSVSKERNQLNIGVGTPFNTNILRLALNNKEETVAMILAYKYQVCIDDKMLIRAIKTRQLGFLYYVYACNKNWQYIGEENDDDVDSNPDSENQFNIAKNYTTFTYDWLFKQIKKHKPHDFDEIIRGVADWKLTSNENFLKSLLINGHDMIAADYGHIHRKVGHAGIELMQFALDNENELFLKFALKQDVFESGLLV